jgi:ArsR family transcriptional regulator
MEPNTVTATLKVLTKQYCLEIFQLLLQAGPAGMSVGTLADRMALEPVRISRLLRDLRRIEIVSRTSKDQVVVYSVNFEAIHAVFGFLGLSLPERAETATRYPP